MEDTATIRTISAADTHVLRRRVLRPHQPPAACAFPGDDAPDTVHFGAYRGGDLVGIASVYREPMTGHDDADHWRIRGMATEQSLRRRGFGKRLLHACTEHALANGGTLAWCTARSAARNFYAAAGFRTHGPEFELPEIGPHYLMAKPLDREPA